MTAALVSIPWAAVVGALLLCLHRVLAAATTERATLLQRIQAPEVAVAQHVYDAEPDEEPDDDDPAFINIP